MLNNDLYKEIKQLKKNMISINKIIHVLIDDLKRIEALANSIEALQNNKWDFSTPEVTIMEKEENESMARLIKKKENFLTMGEIFQIDQSRPVIMAGPCAIENEAFLELTAKVLQARGIKFLRGGAFKPRTSPYSFQGLKEQGLKIMNNIAKQYDLYTVSEVLDTRQVELVAAYVDILQIGSRNMHNVELLKEVGKTNRPVLLKRGFGATLEEFILAAEYIALQGNQKIILCERGIRTFETSTRNTLDIGSIPIIKMETGLSVIVDLSHSLGRKDIVNSIARAVMAAGADGIMVEVHPEPKLALSDQRQQLNLGELMELLDSLNI